MKGMFHIAEQCVDVFAGNNQVPLLCLVHLARLPCPSDLWL
jgi:hypothetical protein